MNTILQGPNQKMVIPVLWMKTVKKLGMLLWLEDIWGVCWKSEYKAESVLGGQSRNDLRKQIKYQCIATCTYYKANIGNDIDINNWINHPIKRKDSFFLCDGKDDSCIPSECTSELSAGIVI